MGVALQRDIGSYIKPAVGVKPVTASGAVNGASVDRLGFESCVLYTMAGAATGSPTAQTLDAKLQDSADGSTGWADVSGAAITQITADNGAAEIDVELSGVKRYVRVVQTIGFTGGTSPTWPAASAVVLGGASSVPA